MIALLAGAAMLVGALSGSRDMLQPLAGLRGGSGAARAPQLPFAAGDAASANSTGACRPRAAAR